MVFDRIILSSNEDKRFTQFIPLVSFAWKKFFPDVKITLAFISDKDINDPIFEKIKRYVDDLNIFKTIDGIPTGNEAKVCRHIMAGYYPDDVCLIHDLDSLPLQRDFHYNLISQRIRNSLLAVGREVYQNTPHEGKFPSGHMTAEGKVFKQLFNPDNCEYIELIKKWSDLKVFDHKEATNQDPLIFSDESLIRAIISLSKNVNVQYVCRNINAKIQWVDRSWWNIDKKRLYSGGYTECNLLRPFDDNFNSIEPIVEYIYGKKLTREEIIFSI